MVLALITFAEEAAHSEGADATPYIIGVGVFIFLLALLAGLVAFGGGREHS